MSIKIIIFLAELFVKYLRARHSTLVKEISEVVEWNIQFSNDLAELQVENKILNDKLGQYNSEAVDLHLKVQAASDEITHLRKVLDAKMKIIEEQSSKLSDSEAVRAEL